MNDMPNDFSRVNIPKTHLVTPYLGRALDAIASLNSVSVQDLANELNLGVRHTLSVINALELEKKVRLRRGKWELR